MELKFTLEKKHVLEAVKLSIPAFEKKKLGRVATYLGNAALNIAGITFVYVVLLITFWVVNFIWGYQVDGFSLFVGFIVGAVLVILLLVLRVRAVRKARVESSISELQHCALKVSPDFILLSRHGFDQFLALSAVGAVTRHDTILIIWHPYGHIIIPRSAFPDAKSESEFLNTVRSGSGSTLN